MDRLRSLVSLRMTIISIPGWQSSRTQDDNRLQRGIRLRAAGRAETKNPPRQSARRVSENLLGNSKSSLAVFYVEQVALNRHVSPQPQLVLLCLSACPMSRGHETGHSRGGAFRPRLEH